ncbi:hypothetical protein ACFCYC_15235 [Streptomyces sp. NPDC056402]|uniref:hypothetical protein n=1 Tax=Streptomyces sp. NPDC056402 TaxID=3345810 RepID=UPI0035DA2332
MAIKFINRRPSVEDVASIGRVETKTIDPKNPTAQQRLHVYTGWINVGMENHNGPHDTFRDQIVSFVPISPGVIETFTDVTALLGTTVTVSPASVALDESNTIFAVDGASVAPGRQKLPGVAGTPFFPILKIDLAIQAGELLWVTYQVTALWKGDATLTRTPLPGSTAPE